MNNSKKATISWIMYDWANSVFYTTVMAGFFPLFFKKYWSSGVDENITTQRLGLILAVAGFLLAIMSPILGTISDKRKSKKKLLFIFMILGSLSTFFLGFVSEGNWLLAASLYGLAFFCCTASTVFYDSLLVSVADPENYDRVSSLGYAYGYLSGGLLFTVNVLMYLKPELFGISSQTQGILISFRTVSIWWFIFTWPLMKYVSEPVVENTEKKMGPLILESVSEIKKTFREIRLDKNLIYFLISYWFYIDGVSTVMSMAVDFGASLNLDAGALIKALLLTQFVGFPAAYLAGLLSEKISSQQVLKISLIIYIIVVTGATQMATEWHFYVMAGFIGLAQGAIQALSRSYFASLIPNEKSGEYFGFFNLLGKFASVLGPLLVTLTSLFFKNPRYSILSLNILFIMGLYYLIKVKRLKKSE